MASRERQRRLLDHGMSTCNRVESITLGFYNDGIPITDVAKPRRSPC
jgi:hypothetical protein